MFLTGSILLFLAVGAYSLLPNPTLATVTVETRPEGARVALGNQACDAAPCTFHVHPGDYRAQATLQNHMKFDEVITVEPGGQTKTIRLIPLVPSPEEAKRMGLQDKPVTTIKMRH